MNVKWKPPNSEVIKINVDAAVDINANRVDLGLVARDAEGSVLMTALKSI